MMIMNYISVICGKLMYLCWWWWMINLMNMLLCICLTLVDELDALCICMNLMNDDF
jgi:hypothetical protein